MARSKLQALARSLTLVASVGAPCLAQAADLLPPPPPPPVAPPVEVGGGWYLRGDVGASAYANTTYTAYGETKGATIYDESYRNTGMGGGAFAGVGVGYQFNNFFRGDVTGEYRFSNGIEGTRRYETEGTYTNFNPTGPDTQVNLRSRTDDDSKARFDSVVVLANGYFDLGTWYGVTPFVGGGVGVAFNTLSGAKTDARRTEPTIAYCIDACGNFLPYAVPGAYSTRTDRYDYKDKTTTSFAWALHAGLAYDVTSNFKVELAYRYLNLGSAKTGLGESYCCSGIGGYKVKTLEAHDVKLGVRYLLGGYAAAPLPPLMADYQPAPGPLVRKY
ncbi:MULTISPECIES: outer membrane protein [Methylobacterium]|uniref:outer membrane protein n=1 Tax=Methylobacterium TaxID=407 RepID=UPI00105060A9|nr:MULTISPECIES: outer membrane beta-barrel protein [Methylobacterium]MDR7036219.1 opacity protein-like surface antigen [Methylobacterium sp. BE186]